MERPLSCQSHKDQTRPTICVGVLTLNEAHRIERCLRSAAFADQLIVVDSGSTDDTCSIAQRCGAEVYIYSQWEGFATQRNRLLTHVKTDYIFFLDADEVITPKLKEEILSVISSRPQGAWRVSWEEVAFGRPLSRMSSGGAVTRLFKTDLIERFDGVVHEGAILRQPIKPQTLQARLPHYSRETVYDSLNKLAQYVQLGAQKRHAQGKKGGLIRGSLSALGNFIRLYFIRRGFLCGAEGFLFCYLIAQECFFRYAAMKYDHTILDTPAKRK